MNEKYLEKILDIINKISQLSEVERIIIFELLLSTMSFSIAKIINHSIGIKNLREDFNFKIEKEIIASKKQSNTNQEINEQDLFKKAYGISIVAFIRKLQEHFSELDLNLLYNNIINLNIEQKQEKYFEKTVKAHYNTIENKIYFTQGIFFKHINHELFHVASYDKENNLCGFNQIDIGIGLGLNEGYTALLTERYFNQDNSGYSYERGIAENIEIIIGQSQMEKFYLTADLYSVVETLSKYQTEDNIKNILIGLDFICKYKNKSTHTKQETLMIQKKCCEIHKLLLEIYIKKIVEDYNCNLDDNKLKESKTFFENLNVLFLLGNREFKVMPETQLMNIINTLFKNNDMAYTVTVDKIPKLKRPYPKKLTK